VLRAGLEQLEKVPTDSQEPYRIKAVNLGPKITNIDNIAEILEIFEEQQLDTYRRQSVALD
jgi:hypothetical protein